MVDLILHDRSFDGAVFKVKQLIRYQANFIWRIPVNGIAVNYE